MLESIHQPKKFTRIFHHYEKLEEYHAGMWRIVRGKARKGYIESSADLMRQADDFAEAMRQALDDWPLSCEMNLTAPAVNKLAWLGHAGCCIAVGSPEECTRVGWHTLNPQEQNDANAAAAVVLLEWQTAYAMNETDDLFGPTSC